MTRPCSTITWRSGRLVCTSAPRRLPDWLVAVVGWLVTMAIGLVVVAGLMGGGP